MTLEEIEDNAKEARELAEVFYASSSDARYLLRPPTSVLYLQEKSGFVNSHNPILHPHFSDRRPGGGHPRQRLLFPGHCQ